MKIFHNKNCILPKKKLTVSGKVLNDPIAFQSQMFTFETICNAYESKKKSITFRNPFNTHNNYCINYDRDNYRFFHLCSSALFTLTITHARHVHMPICNFIIREYVHVVFFFIYLIFIYIKLTRLKRLFCAHSYRYAILTICF